MRRIASAFPVRRGALVDRGLSGGRFEDDSFPRCPGSLSLRRQIRPQAEAPSRKSAIDSLVAGCIPPSRQRQTDNRLASFLPSAARTPAMRPNREVGRLPDGWIAKRGGKPRFSRRSPIIPGADQVMHDELQRPKGAGLAKARATKPKPPDGDSTGEGLSPRRHTPISAPRSETRSRPRGRNRKALAFFGRLR